MEWNDKKNKKEMASNSTENIKIYNKYTDTRVVVLDSIMSWDRMYFRLF